MIWFDIAFVFCIISLIIENYDLRTCWRYDGERCWKVCFILNLLVIASFMVGVIQVITELL